MSTRIINLLPKEEQHQLHLRSWYRMLTRLYLFAGATFVLVVLICLAVGWFLDFAGAGLAREIEALKAQATNQETTDLKQQIKTVNSQITDYNQLAAVVPRWSRLLTRFAQLVPVGVQIDNLSVDSTKRQVVISGFAPTRELVISLHDNIAKDSEYFENINYPLENVSKPINVSFSYTFTVKEQVLQ